MPNNPFEIFTAWLAEAEKSESEYPNAMSLATLSETGDPDVRVVLLKSFDEKGFVFFTNYKSKKSKDIIAHPRVSIGFHWKSLNRQVRIAGVVEKVSEAESDAYFQSRPRLSQIGAWASIQSTPIANEHDFEKRIAQYTLKFNVGTVPRPDFWGGYRVIPNRIEFWSEKPFRMHERQVFTRNAQQWDIERLYP